jgi:hypothetical protein
LRRPRTRERQDEGRELSYRSYGSFSRQIPLDFSVDPPKGEATFDKGVLKIHVPNAGSQERDQEDRDQGLSLAQAERREAESFGVAFCAFRIVLSPWRT